MSATKRLLFDRSPEPQAIRAVWTEKLGQAQSRLPVRIATRRKNPLYGRRWDPLWPSCLRSAANELGIEAARINDGLFVASDADAERVMERAKGIWDEKVLKLQPKGPEVEF